MNYLMGSLVWMRQHRLGFILASLVGRIYPSMVPTGQEIVTL